MQDNQRYVRRLKEMVSEEPQVNVETDFCYNNRPQVAYEAATQSFCPMLEQDTNKKIVVSMETANKLCLKKIADIMIINANRIFPLQKTCNACQSET